MLSVWLTLWLSGLRTESHRVSQSTRWSAFQFSSLMSHEDSRVPEFQSSKRQRVTGLKGVDETNRTNINKAAAAYRYRCV